MFDDLKQFVTPDYCHSCRGCCVFHEAESIWGPHVVPAEADEMMRQGFAAKFSQDRRHILTEPAGASHRCAFLAPTDHHCRIYQNHPFECRLYPFVISCEQGHLRMYAHLACPFIQEKFHSAEGRAYLSYLQDYFSHSSAQETLRAALGTFPDYSSATEQIEMCFDIGGLDLLHRRHEISSWLALRDRFLSASSFVNLFAWKDFFMFCIDEIDGNLCVFADQPAGTFLYWPPLGETISAVAVEACFARMREKNKGGGMSRIENVSREELRFFDTARYIIHLQGHEYVYYRQDIADLKGDDYKSKRHDINQLIRRTCVEYKPFTSRHMSGCCELFDRWLDKRMRQHEDDTYRYMLQENRSVHRLLIENADALGLVGRIVMVDGRIAGYTFGYPLSKNVFCDLLEVADPDVPGLAAFLFREFCADAALAPFVFVNAMDDFGMPNVSRGKMSYRPAFLEPMYSVSERGDVQSA
jgi:Fe-S-cluster containining protein